MEAAKEYKIEVLIIPKNVVGPNVKAPAIYLDEKVLCEDGGVRNGKITIDELKEELEKANVPKYLPR